MAAAAWSSRTPRVAACSSWPIRDCHRFKRWCAGIPRGTPPRSSPPAPKSASRPRCGWLPSTRAAALKDILDELTAELPAVDVLGPVELDPAPDGRDVRGDEEARERALVRVPRARGRELAAALHVAQSARTARKATDLVRVRMDPPDIG